MNYKRQKGEETYRQKFEALGLDFTFLRREWSREHDRRFWVKCNRCGTELLRNNDVFKHKTKTIRCHECGNGLKKFSEQSNEVINFYTEGHSIKETVEKFGITRSQLNELVRARGVSNGRHFGADGNTERLLDSEKAARKNAALFGIVLFDSWQGINHEYVMMDVTTGEFFKASGRILFPGYSQKYPKREMIIVDNDIDLVKLIERDGTRCYICGKETNLRDRRWGKCGPDYPTIDHIKAIKNGGLHSWENVKVCCALCNITKGANDYDTN